MWRILLLVPFLTGCTHQPGAFRLTASAGQLTLIPPDFKDFTVSRAALRIGPFPRKTVCPPSPHGLVVQRKWLSGPRVVVTRDAIESTTGPELFAWTVELEKQGCIPANGALALWESLIDALPLDLAKRAELTRGRADLKEFDSLQVISPIYKDSPPANSNNLTVDLKSGATTAGYEITWYDMTPRALGQPGYQVQPRSAEIHVDGAIRHPAAPTTPRPRFQSDPHARRGMSCS